MIFKNKYTILLLLLLGGILYAFSAFGAVSYSRSPAGENITSPVSISASFDSISETGLSTDYWTIAVDTEAGEITTILPCVSSSTLSNSGDMSFPINTEAISVYTIGNNDLDECNIGAGNVGINFESNDIIFKIISGVVVSNNYLSVPSLASSDLLGLVSIIFNDFWSIIALIIGVPLSFVIINKIISLMPSDKKHKELIAGADKAIAESKRISRK